MEKKLLKRIIISITLLQLAVIVIFIQKIVIGLRTKNTIIAPIKKTAIQIEPGDTLKNFYEPKPNSLGINKEPSWLPYIPTYTINSDTLHDRFSYATTKNPGTFRIITLGDSFTYGLYVDTKDNWTEVLEDMIRTAKPCKNYTTYEIINLAIPGYDTRYSVERFIKRGEKYNPDLVIWFLKDDDFAEIRDKELDKKYATLDIHTTVKDIMNENGKGFVIAYQKKALQDFSKAFAKRLLLYTTKDLLRSDFNLDAGSILKDYAKNRPQTFFYTSALHLTPGQNAFTEDPHPNQLGHKMIAQDIFSYLQTNHVLCN